MLRVCACADHNSGGLVSKRWRRRLRWPERQPPSTNKLHRRVLNLRVTRSGLSAVRRGAVRSLRRAVCMLRVPAISARTVEQHRLTFPRRRPCHRQTGGELDLVASPQSTCKNVKAKCKHFPARSTNGCWASRSVSCGWEREECGKSDQ